MNIWQDLPKPIFALAPMDDVTDTVFRRVVAGCARPDVFFTEFANADGLNSPGRKAVMEKLRFTDTEQPLVAQIWGLNPENFHRAANELAEIGFAGVDINMGCPVKNVVKMGACSALMNDRILAAEIILATKAGANGRLPVSVKTRVGFNKVDESWTQFLLEQGLDALIVHGRTTKEQSKVPNRWDAVERVREQRDALAAADTVLIGNGDVMSKIQGREICNRYALDGVMIGRGIFRDPYAFADKSPWPGKTPQEKLSLFLEHIKLLEQEWGGRRNPASLKKFAKVYVNGFDGASELRARLMQAKTTIDLKKELVKA